MADTDFFTEEAKMARAALRNLIKQTGKTLQKDADVRPLIRKRPWIAVLAAAGGGFAAGYVATPPRLEPEEKRRLRRIRKVRKHRSAHRFQKSITDAVGPALRSFAATAAGVLFHSFQQGEDANHASETHETTVGSEEYAHIPSQRIQI